MTETATPKRRKTSSAPAAPAISPETAPDKTPHPSPRGKDAPRTMRDLRLAHRKVIPALYQLWRTNLLPHEFVVLAIGRRDCDDDSLRSDFRASLEKYSRVLPLDEAAWRSFSSRIRYERMDFDNPAAFDHLVRTLEGIDKEQNGPGNHLYYLATQPSAFAEIVGELGRVGLDHERHEGGWRRIVIEKPFGHDLNSAIRLNREVGKVFRES